MIGEEQDPLLGAVLDGRYQVQSLLGKGGMGKVYAAEEIHLRRRCALKLLRPEHAENPAIVERFFREAQVIAQLSHENIVEIYSFGKDPGGAVFFAMELLTGEDLEARLRDRNRGLPTWQEICRWGVQIARALAAVHEAGYVHRDLKPGNIYLAHRRDGAQVIKLLDFGIVRPPDSELTSTGAVLGTMAYVSPEQVRAGLLDGRSDIYSFGILLYRALVGQLPFRGDAAQLIYQHLNDPPPRLAEALTNGEIPPRLVDIIDRCLRKPREDRFQTVQAVEQALVRVLAHVPADEADEADEADAATNILAPRGALAQARRTAQPPRTATVSRQSVIAISPTSSGPNPAPESAASEVEHARVVEPDRPSPLGDPSAPPLETESVPPGAAVIQHMPPTAAPRGSFLGWWVVIAVCVMIVIVATVLWPTQTEPVASVISIEQHDDATVAPLPLPLWQPLERPPPAPPLELEAPVTPDPPVRVNRPITPSRVVTGKAKRCRRKHPAVAGRIRIEYTVSDGKVLGTKAVLTPQGAPEALIECLEDAVRGTRFDHEFEVGRSIEL